MLIEEQIVRFLQYLQFEKRSSLHSIEAYKTDLTQFASFLNSQFAVYEVPHIQSGFIRTWLAWLKEQGVSTRTLNRKISALRSWYKHLRRQGYQGVNPLQAVVAPKQPNRLPQYVEVHQMENLWSAVTFEDGFAGVADKLMLMLLYHTGIRRAELMGLKVQHVNVPQRLIKVLGKGSKERMLPINDELAYCIEDYLKQKQQLPAGYNTEFLLVRPNGQPLYARYVYNRVHFYLSQITTLAKKSPHILRHSFATHLANAGADMNAIKELLGHSSLAATQVYTHNTIDKLKAAHKQAHPKA
ncbi:MAG TPA: tyrosine-type recombinase/integrase [Phnomibacter sp.]|nr:tyrosine-type recombinase/integrase [Phnomibacter sp.]